MTNSSDRKRIIHTFRKYSRLGLASQRLDAFDAYDRIRGCSRTRREAKELLAVYDTVRILKLTDNREVLAALYDVYFSLSGRTLRKSDISNRILRHACDNNCDERTVYRRLSYAFSLYKKMLGE